MSTSVVAAISNRSLTSPAPTNSPIACSNLPNAVGEAYWIRHPHSPFGLALTSGTTGSLEVYSTSVSWKFIGGSSPSASVEGAPRSLQMLAQSSVMAAGFVLSYPRACGVCVSRVDAHGVTKKASGTCERPAV
jgi:hypothetical protein